MDARMYYTTQLTADHMANLHATAAVHRLRRGANASTINESSTDRVVLAPRHPWWRALGWHRPTIRPA